MDFGFSIPGRGPLATRKGICALASRREELGFACLGVPDHIVVPRNIDSRYPYSSTGSFPGAASGDCVEQLSIMSYLAGITSKVKIPTIGIGSGPNCDGQIQVFHDVLGLFNKIVPKHTKQFVDGHKHLTAGLKKYKTTVEKGVFPDSKHYTKLSAKVLKELSESS